MRTAISPRFATRTRLMGPSAISRSPTSNLARQSERVEGLAKPRRMARGATIDRGDWGRPGVMLVHGEAQSCKHEILRRYAVRFGLFAAHPHEWSLAPFHRRLHFGWPFECHAGAHRARLSQGP